MRSVCDPVSGLIDWLSSSPLFDDSTLSNEGWSLGEVDDDRIIRFSFASGSDWR